MEGWGRQVAAVGGARLALRLRETGRETQGDDYLDGNQDTRLKRAPHEMDSRDAKGG